MSADAPAAGGFSPRGMLALVLFGAVVFVALLWMIGAGMATGPTNNGGSHAGGRGLNGYSAFAAYLERRGRSVRQSRTEAALDDAGLLILTPPQDADGKELERIVTARRMLGPTIVITPKWIAAPAPATAKGVKRGWVYLLGAAPPTWQGFLDDVGVRLAPGGRGKHAPWTGAGVEGELPDTRQVLSGSGPRLVPLVSSRADGRMLAAYVDDGGDYPALRDIALARGRSDADDEDLYPLVVVFEPDLLDNWGMGRQSSAVLAERLVTAAGGFRGSTVTFDLTLNGLGRSANLLTLAFTPPFLAATLCLLFAALIVGWRAFVRFGPPRRASRAIAFGKAALVANAAALIRRTNRFHLVSAPYLSHTRQRLARALALPRELSPEATDAAIDRALSARDPAAAPFTVRAAKITAARRPHDLVKAAQDLHSLERMLTR